MFLRLAAVKRRSSGSGDQPPKKQQRGASSSRNVTFQASKVSDDLSYADKSKSKSSMPVVTQPAAAAGGPDQQATDAQPEEMVVDGAPGPVTTPEGKEPESDIVIPKVVVPKVPGVADVSQQYRTQLETKCQAYYQGFQSTMDDYEKDLKEAWRTFSKRAIKRPELVEAHRDFCDDATKAYCEQHSNSARIAELEKELKATRDETRYYKRNLEKERNKTAKLEMKVERLELEKAGGEDA